MPLRGFRCAAASKKTGHNTSQGRQRITVRRKSKKKDHAEKTMKKYEDNKLYRALSKIEKNAFEAIGNFEFNFTYQTLDLNKKIRLAAAIESMDDFYDEYGRPLEGYDLELAKYNIGKMRSSILFDLYYFQDLFWTIKSEITQRTYIFRDKDADSAGVFLFTDETFAKKKIYSLGLKDCCVEPVEDPYDFIHHGIFIEGYEYVDLITGTSSIRIEDEELLWDFNSPLTVRINEYAQIDEVKDEEAFEKLENEITEILHDSFLFVPVPIENNKAFLSVHTDELGEKTLHVYTSFEEYREQPAGEIPGCMFMSTHEVLALADAHKLTVVINPDSAAFYIDEVIREKLNQTTSEGDKENEIEN